MVQGIAFLSKKSWHTKTLANQERVWKAERAQETEERRTKELARQIQQEREQEELDKLAGKKSRIDRGIDWMYQGQGASGGKEGVEKSELEQQDAEKRNEEYLLGKEFTGESGAGRGDFTQGSDGVNAVVRLEDPMANMKPAAVAGGGDTVADRNETFRQQMEDPMFMVSQKEREKKTEAEKQRALFERVMGPMDDGSYDSDNSSRDGGKNNKKSKKHERKKRDRKERRRRKEERKRKRSKHHRDRYSSDSGSEEEESDDERRHRRKHHDGRRRERDRDHDDRKSRSSKKKRRRSRSRSRSESPDARRHRHRRHERENHHHEEGRSGGRHHRDRDRDRDRDHHNHHNSRREREREDHHHHHNHHPHSASSKREEGPAKKAGFGLQGGGGAEKKRSSDLGPAQHLLRQKEQSVEEERRRTRDRASSRRTMTPEERAQALQEMQSTAEERMTKSLSQKQRHGDDDEAPRQRGNAAFLKDMNEEAHGLKGPTKSLSQRMRENRNTQQRKHEDDFL